MKRLSQPGCLSCLDHPEDSKPIRDQLLVSWADQGGWG